MDSASALGSLVRGMAENTAACLKEGRCPRCGHDRDIHEHPDWTDSYTSGLLYEDCDDCPTCKPQLRLQAAIERERQAQQNLIEAQIHTRSVLIELGEHLDG